MDTKTKIFWLIIGILIFISFSATGYRYLIKKDYIIQAETDCDPYTETCFIWECDLESEEEGEMCTGNPEEDIWYYKIITRNAKNIPLCDVNNDENCRALVCEENESECSFILCTEENKEEFGVETCSDPIAYALENPIEEECAEDDEECLLEEIEGTEEEGEEEPMTQTTEDMINSEELAEDSEGEEEVQEGGNLPVAE